MRNDTEVKWWRSIYNSIILKRATVQSVNDVNDIPTMQVKYLKDVIKIVQKLGLYGICGNPPKGSSGILFPILGSDSNLVCLADDIKNRFRDLKEGEVVIGNYLTKSFIKFKEDGGVEIHAKYITQVAEDGDISLSAGNNIINTAKATNIGNPLNVNDNVTVSKKVTATEDVIGGGKSLKLHTHISSSPGDPTSPPE